MNITSIHISLAAQPHLKAYVSITLDSCFLIRDLKIIDNGNGLFVAMPNKKGQDGSYRDIAHPLNSEMRALLEDKILDKYEAMVERL